MKRRPYAVVSTEPSTIPMSGMSASGATAVEERREHRLLRDEADRRREPDHRRDRDDRERRERRRLPPTPESSPMSRVDSWRSMTPTTRNSDDLNSAWPSRSARPASAELRSP
jgi:hypothetical protein